jgi:hypothetical protein
MEKVFDRANRKLRGWVHQADMAAKSVVKLVKGILHGKT